MFDQRGTEYRPYLDGLRAIAVGGVIVYHLNAAWLPGGYLGVDLFFVLSGYLITTLLVREHRRSGGIDLPAFWSRRVRRLMPALMVLLIAVSVDVFLQGDELAAASARGDLLATLFYFANWHFIFTDQSYFAQFIAASPVRHTWSLAIEEQFYIAWPLVVGLVLGRLGPRALTGVAAVLSLASVAATWLLFDAASDPSRAYYGTDARIYQILIGAVLAMALLGRWRERLLAVARRLAVPALLAVAAMMLLLADDSSLYYHGGGAAFVLAGAVLIAGLEAGSRLGGLLSLKPLVAIGLVSYGLYLWHWPVTLFVERQLGPTDNPIAAAAVIAATAALATISYILVERPIRRGAGVGSFRLNPRRLLAVVPVTSGIVALSILLATSIGTTPIWALGSVPSAAPATRDPDTSPGTVPPGPVTLGVVGDSVMLSAIPGLRTEAQERGWALVEAAFAGCPVGYEPLYDARGAESSFNQTCEVVRPAHDALIAAGPDVVIWHDLQSVLSRRSPSGDLLIAGSGPWADDLVAEWEVVLDRLTDGGSEVVIVLPPRRSQDPPRCADLARPERCREVQVQDELIRATTQLLWSRVRDRPQVHLIEVDDLLCPHGYPCPATVDGVEVRQSGWDQTHFTEQGASWFASRLLDAALAEIGSDAPATGAHGP